MSRAQSGPKPRHHDLKFWLEGRDGFPYLVNLIQFAEGGKRENLPSRLQSRWVSDFQGRPGFAYGLADVFLEMRPPKYTQRTLRASCRQLMRFLDVVDPDRNLSSFDDLNDSHGFELRRWAEANGNQSGLYKQIKGLVDTARSVSGATPLFWPARRQDAPVHKDDIDERGLQRFYTALKKEAMSVKDMFREGDSLADTGRDPRRSRLRGGSADWASKANHAWLVRNLTNETLLYKEEFYAAGATGLNKANNAEIQKHHGPEYLAPGMTERGRQGIVGKLRWFHPSYHDTAIFLWLFHLGTGWNFSTSVSVDVSRDEAWFEPHPQMSEVCIIHSVKRRAAKYAFAHSLVKPEWHPFQILKYMLARTAPLRRTVIQRLAKARARHAIDQSPETAAKVARLDMMSRSPWLYHVTNKIGEIGCLYNEDSNQMNAIARIVAEKHMLLEDHPTLATITTRESRDAWIGHAYTTSGNNLIIARLAAQHADHRSLAHYLRRRRYRAQSENHLRRFQNAAFAEIESGRMLDAARVKLMVERGEITREQESRLLDMRQRTRLGMGCLTPESPPQEISPDHVPGTVCLVQRCTGCSAGIVFEESLDSLARARAELLHIQRTIPLAAWSGSSFEDEAQSLDATLAGFDPAEVQQAIQRWEIKLQSGEVQSHDTYPAC